MASQWIRWNQTTHIFEYSTDNGASFVPLPLSAATINEGNIPDAILSPNVVREDLANIFTNALPISIENANPIIQFKETDQAADSRFWRESIQGGTYRLQSLTDALGATDLLTVDRTGALGLSQNADHIIGGNVGASVNRLRVKNIVAGATRFAGLSLDTDVGQLGALSAFTSGWTTTAWDRVSGVSLLGAGSGGLSIVTSHASGDIQFYSGGVTSPRMQIFAGGGIDIVKSADQGTLRLYRNSVAVSGSPEGGILFMGLGIKHSGIGYTPATSGSRMYMGFGSSNDIHGTFNKNITMFDAIIIPVDGIFQTPWSNGCLMTLTHSQTNKFGMFACSANGGSVEISDPALGFSNTLNTANMINVYYIGGGIWGIQNKTAASVTLTVNMIGISQ